MKQSQLIILLIVWSVGFAFLSLAFWDAVVQPQIYVFIYGTRRPLNVYFRFPNNTAKPQFGSVNDYHPFVFFELALNSHTPFNFDVSNMGAMDPIEDIALYIDSISEKLTLLSLTNQSYSLPFRIDVGAIEINQYKDYRAIIETPSELGTYEIQWHITSNTMSYSFKIIIRVSK